MAFAGSATEVLLPGESDEVCEMAQIHASMIDLIYRAVERITLTNRVVEAIL